MGKNKLKKFADLSVNPLVFEYPFVRLQEEGCAFRGGWNREVFGQDRPLVVELGCGKGEYAVNLSKVYPNKNFIGMDRKGARIWTGATQAQEEGLANVAFVRSDIHLIPRIFAPQEVDELWITFPDPQMKKRRARLLSSTFFSLYTQFLKPNGVIHLKTDSQFLFLYTLSLLEANGIAPEVYSSDLYGNSYYDHKRLELPDIYTFYEKQWLIRGKSIKYIRFNLPHFQTFVEPETEPAPDDYTSWTRVDAQVLQQIEESIKENSL